MFFAPVSLFFCFSIEKENKLVRILLFTPTYNIKLLQLPKALNIELCMPKNEALYGCYSQTSFKLLNDFALTQKTCMRFACPLVAYL